MCGGRGHLSPERTNTRRRADRKTNKGTDTERKRVSLKAAAVSQPVPTMFSIIGDAISVHIVMVGRDQAPIAACTAGREITPNMAVKIVTTMTRNKQEFADNTAHRVMLPAKVQVNSLTIRRLQ